MNKIKTKYKTKGEQKLAQAIIDDVLLIYLTLKGAKLGLVKDLKNVISNAGLMFFEEELKNLAIKYNVRWNHVKEMSEESGVSNL